MKFFSPSKWQHWVALLGVMLCCVATWGAIRTVFVAPSNPKGTENTTTQAVRDSVPAQRKTEQERVVPFKVRPTSSSNTKDDKPHSGDLKDPDNLATGLFYDEATGLYKYGTKVGDHFVFAPIYMGTDEVMREGIRRSMLDYFRNRNKEEYRSQGKNKFDFTDMQFSLGPAEKIFGPGGVRVRTQGSAELKLGANHRWTDNPALSERNRSVFGFDFNEKVNLSLNGKVGDKVNMDFNYNSEATFNFDAQNLKLRYEGKEDEIVKLIEAGNVSMPTQSSLIRGGQSLFGLRTDMQFGRLKLQTMIAQKKTAAQTVNSRGGVQLTDFEFSASDYDENRHFFLAHFFRNHYDQWMSQLPNVLSGVTINRIELWVTNKNGATNNTRNIVALTDLGESQKFNKKVWTATGNEVEPSNRSNNAYNFITQTAPKVRDISQSNTQLDAMDLVGGEDYEKLESARLLNSSEYSLNTALGYVSLKSTLQPDQVLAVAYEYTYRGQTYQVGEFSTDIKDNTQALLVKSLKNTANTPKMGNWKLMMRNVYSLGATAVQREHFTLDIKYLSDTTGVYLSYLPTPRLKDKRLLSVLGLDHLDNNARRIPNGYFDFVEGYTIDASSGRVFFPQVEPFGSFLTKVIGDSAVARPFAYTELYDSTRTIAKQVAEHNKFVIKGRYKATKNDEIVLNTSGIPQGSVVVTAGGQVLTEGTDYTVDYSAGVVRILNKSILDAGTPIQCSVESNTDYGLQRKTMLGLNWQYDFSRDFQFGGSLLHLSEQPLTSKVAMGSEPLNNTLWGLNMAWKQQSQWLTDVVNRLPFVHTSSPSSINFTAEFAHLIAGQSSEVQGRASYVDDFENAKTEIDVSSPQQWTLSSVPSMFAESQFNNDVRSGYNRARLAWYTIDPLFTRRNSSLTPGYIKSDLRQLSDARVRDIYVSDLYPNKSLNYKDAATLPVLNLAFYPNERGPYNLDPALDRDGHLVNPTQRWGGMMRRLETSDFEAANVAYIEFWMMDPFTEIDGKTPNYTGDLYFNLGEISEDVLRDGRKFYESGMPVDGDRSQLTQTAWGWVPNQNAVTYAFNTTSDSRRLQDIGFNGLTSEEERSFGPYAKFLQEVRSRVRPEVYDSILQSPSADKYHYYRGTDFDEQHTSILDRYKFINNPNGNSVAAEASPERYSTAYKTTPDVEDINQDYTLNEYEKFYQYRVQIRPEAMQVGQNYIVDSRTINAKTRDGKTPETKWYLFRIPIEQYERRFGNISDFSSIRFMRMFMTGFNQPAVLRLATLNLVRGEWRDYEQPLYTTGLGGQSGQMVVSAVNFEENNEKTPVNYVLPPGISRSLEPGQEQVLENNEQALSLTIKDLSSGDARAVYKNTQLDLRRYKHLQLFVHANALPGDKDLTDGQMSLFVRLGSDYKNNFYEYEIPLTLTPEGRYGGEVGRGAVWPQENMLDVDLDLFTHLKANRNRQKAQGTAAFTQLFSEYDPHRPKNKVSVQGNPSLGEVRTIMIGVRNNSRAPRSVEVWANELRLQDFSNQGGWAAQSQLNVQLSDLATINLSGHIETNGFGGLEETVSQRRNDDLSQFSITTNVDAGKLLPEKVKLTAPIYYSYSKEVVTPRYNPLDTDMPMAEALNALPSAAQRDSLRELTSRVVVNKNFSVSGLRFNRTTQGTPMPYDLSNFTVGFAQSSRHTAGTTIAWERDMNWKMNFAYAYSPGRFSFEPLRGIIKSKSPWLRIFRDFGINYLPQSIAFNSDISRHYYELQERDMENLENKSLPLTFSSDFLWNRSFQLRWDPTKNIHFNFSSGTNAEIEQPNTPVNEALYPDRYTAWKDSITRSILELGRPLAYQQNAELSWNVPLNKIPALDWVTVDAKYSSSYNWTRGIESSTGQSLGNTIANRRDLSANGRFNMENLYNKVEFLKRVNRKFSQPNNHNSKPEKKFYEKEIVLRADTSFIVPHNQGSKKLRVIAIRKDGTRYALKYKVLDINRIEVLTRGTDSLKITVSARKRLEEQTWYKIAEVGARGLMSLRNFNVSYRNNNQLSLPGFMPNIGNVFGQSRLGGMFVPGLDFAFATAGEDYVQRANERGWLLRSDSLTALSTFAQTEDFQLRAQIEPARDLRISVSFSRNHNRNKSIQYMFEGMPTLQSGSFAMTTLSLGSAFSSSGTADNGYRSALFQQFLGALNRYQARIEQQYAGTTYPAGLGTWSGQTYNPENGSVGKYSSEVMIPAFLDTYTSMGSSVEIFPLLTKLLPNWTLTYSGLSSLPAFKRWFRAFNINHSYRSLYNVGSYSSFQNYRATIDGLGFINNVENGRPQPSSQFDISTVSINENFSPLLGVDATFHNNMTAKLEMRRTRVLTLSMASQLLTETHSNDVVFGVGYRINDFKFPTFGDNGIKGKGKKSRNSSASSSTDYSNSSNYSGDASGGSSDGFAHSLNLRLDISLREQSALQRNILTTTSQATSGNSAIQISFSADYAVSRFFTISAYYERQMNRPLLTSSAFPTTVQDFGLNLKFQLAR